MIASDDLPPVVIDHGSDMLKAGFADDEEPVQLRTMVSRYQQCPDRMLNARPGMYDPQCEYIRSPIIQGVVVNWDDLEALWDYIFVKKLITNPADRNLLILDDLWSPEEQKTQLAEQIFERYKVPGVAVAPPQVSALVAAGRITGLVIDSGAHQTSIVPIQSCNPLMMHAVKMPIGGNTVTEFLATLLGLRGLLTPLYMKHDSVRDMKEKLAFVPELSAFVEDCNISTYYFRLWESPYGQSLLVERERYRCAEVIFDPPGLGYGYENERGLIDKIFESVYSCPPFLRKYMMNNVVIAGGNTMLPGFCPRLHNELTARLIADMTADDTIFDPLLLGLVTMPNRAFAAWRGGCTLCTSPTYIPHWTTREEYYEQGVHRLNYCYFYNSPL